MHHFVKQKGWGALRAKSRVHGGQIWDEAFMLYIVAVSVSMWALVNLNMHELRGACGLIACKQ
jgi:hypothetical protein